LVRLYFGGVGLKKYTKYKAVVEDLVGMGQPTIIQDSVS
jgi:hypothetical protein